MRCKHCGQALIPAAHFHWKFGQRFQYKNLWRQQYGDSGIICSTSSNGLIFHEPEEEKSMDKLEELIRNHHPQRRRKNGSVASCICIVQDSTCSQNSSGVLAAEIRAAFDVTEKKPRYSSRNGGVYDLLATNNRGEVATFPVATFWMASDITKPNHAAADNYAAMLNAEEEKKRA